MIIETRNKTISAESISDLIEALKSLESVLQRANEGKEKEKQIQMLPAEYFLKASIRLNGSNVVFVFESMTLQNSSLPKR
jgi:hypothetical protein